MEGRQLQWQRTGIAGSTGASRQLRVHLQSDSEAGRRGREALAARSRNHQEGLRNSVRRMGVAATTAASAAVSAAASAAATTAAVSAAATAATTAVESD